LVAVVAWNLRLPHHHLPHHHHLLLRLLPHPLRRQAVVEVVAGGVGEEAEE
jgi:hypothetical protein